LRGPGLATMNAQTFGIGDLAREFGITTRTIRFYEERGLLHPLRLGQRRRFSAADRVRLKLILRGKRIGLTLEECREIIEMYRPEEQNRTQLTTLLAAVAERRTQLLAQRRDLEETLLALDDVEQRCRTALATATVRHTPRCSQGSSQ
jgi:DNA-binding transcriptional MerR regulator